MSSPDVNLEKQKRRHKGPLIGFGICAVVVGAMLVAYLTRVVEPVAGATADDVPAAAVSQ